MSKEENSSEESIRLELLAEIISKLTSMEKRLDKLENGNGLSIEVDTNYSSKIPQSRSPSLGSIGEKVDEEETLSNTEDIIKEKIRKAVDHIIAYSKEVPYIMNK